MLIGFNTHWRAANRQRLSTAAAVQVGFAEEPIQSLSHQNAYPREIPPLRRTFSKLKGNNGVKPIRNTKPPPLG